MMLQQHTTTSPSYSRSRSDTRKPNSAHSIRCQCCLTHSLRYYLLAIEIRKRALGPGHLLTSHSVTNLANFYNKTSRFDEAEKLHREAKTIVLDTFGDTSPDYAQCMYALFI